MLVYHKEPMGYGQLGTRRVYGRCFSYGAFGPTEISHKTFYEYKDILEEEFIDEKWLEKRFNKKFPKIKFKITEMWKTDFVDLVEVANLIGIVFTKPRHPTVQQRAALRRAIARQIDFSGGHNDAN